ncbi:MAG: acetyl-CoA carboxylase carboxyltransferase subunit alpha [Candidatus Obscuribacter sp.]|jgi:acetyl-CoA carboxylase carboxyl transferase subunit alpha|nr:acetyl-CoA carboxylase carboxyltransferase subunit alpha [Candidatus Obscuribacter sp.]MBK9201905.1 acetyl-CoA carboxylase carboxyltransferase subunit alpha [Candidatus Obscuribacter sp.]MBK9620191.1 acetyl-CoA carboxylase carboxyltransferase subunit alpha [Candidatus Obscuribacter sp.]MBK9772977.1 acetyl-CoA carboxylase carboxyltransferase subunit alpha [Candidatus Obscuribacter sp.]MBL0187937.1 acetyl-CoA carboxylase carboxyltransferase subunit alpha [Candidatus Obscuribacter sp.]
MAAIDKKTIPLEFEQPLAVLAQQIEALEKQLGDNPDLEADIDRLQDQYNMLKKSLYTNLRPFDHLAIARHQQRPYTRDYFGLWDPAWIELHGDRKGADDAALVGGLITLDGIKMVALGTQKGRAIRDKQACNFGMPQPEGYRKALKLFKHADKFGLPVLTLIDTPGAYPGLSAEEHNQAQAIAENLFELAGLTVPVVAVVTGEGGSGGALAIGVANRVMMLEHSVYSVISPEGCASILWRSNDKVSEACQAMKMTAKEILQMGVIDQVIPEPLGGAHHDHVLAAQNLKAAVVKQMKELLTMSKDEVRADRQQKFRAFGAFAN